ncbi:hypothetical protein ROHU_016950 [Labeo rohita]|uniref:Uncharacterized protein n=1 Tax=Labeo rohita TaxID=84645 RepID=A0A498NI09_LABRO|nr:hypothetical protein ROHU_016950 [Labeo rohita]
MTASINKFAVPGTNIKDYSVHKADGFWSNVCKDLQVPNTLTNRKKIREASLLLLKSPSAVESPLKETNVNVEERPVGENIGAAVSPPAVESPSKETNVNVEERPVGENIGAAVTWEKEFSQNESPSTHSSEEDKYFTCALPAQPCFFFIDLKEWQALRQKQHGQLFQGLQWTSIIAKGIRIPQHYKLAMHVFGLLACCSTLKEMDEVVYSSAVVFCSPCSGPNVPKHYNNLRLLMQQRGSFELNEKDVTAEDYKHDFGTTPLMSHFQATISNAVLDLNGPSNIYYSPEFISALAKYFLLYDTLWSGDLGRHGKSPVYQNLSKFYKKVRQSKKQLTELWGKNDTEVVVSEIPSQIRGNSYIIHHSELKSLRPHNWLTGEIAKAVMEAFPKLPNMEFATTKKEMELECRALALTILEASAAKPPGPGPSMTDWKMDINQETRVLNNRFSVTAVVGGSMQSASKWTKDS